MDELLAPNQPAKPSTRLYDKAHWAARAEKTRRLRHRERFGEVSDAERIGKDEDGLIFIEPEDYERLDHRQLAAA
jgi:hypothetical protein